MFNLTCIARHESRIPFFSAAASSLIFLFRKLSPLRSRWIKHRVGHPNYSRTEKQKRTWISSWTQIDFYYNRWFFDRSERREFLYKLFIRSPLIFILLSWGSLFARFMSSNSFSSQDRTRTKQSSLSNSNRACVLKQIFNKLISMLFSHIQKII